MAEREEKASGASKSTQRRRKRRSRKSAFEDFEGVLILERVSRGSKSERDAVHLDLGDATLLVRCPASSGYKESELEEHIGERVSMRGLKRGGRIYVDEWCPVDAEGGL